VSALGPSFYADATVATETDETMTCDCHTAGSVSAKLVNSDDDG
jgi:hypothetical protein